MQRLGSWGRRALRFCGKAIWLVERGLAWLMRIEPGHIRRARIIAAVHAATIGAVVAALLSFAINLFDSFKLNDHADAVSEQAAAIVTGPFYGGFERQGQKAITVVLINQETLDALDAPLWPLPYSDLADILEQIAAENPKAIFLDVHFQKAQRAQQCLDRVSCKAASKAEAADFARRLNRISKTLPLFIGPVSDDQELSSLKALKQLPVSFEDEHLFAYPLAAPLGAGVAKTPAAALYAVWKNQPVGPPSPTELDRVLAIDWGFGMSAAMSRYAPGARPGAACQGANMWQRLASLARVTARAAFAASQKDDDPFAERCGYTDTIPAFWMFGGASAERSALLKDRIVLVGADLRYLADYRPTPLFGEAPGVMAHAMALDNLIEHGDNAIRYPSPLWMGLDQSDLFKGVLLITGVALVFAVRALLRIPPHRTLDWGWRSAIWLLIGGLSVGMACALRWPMFILLGVIVTGAGAMMISDQILGYTRQRDSKRRLFRGKPTS